MAIARVNEPTPSGPLTLATGYQRQNTKSEAQVQSFTDRAIVDGSTIHAGAVFPIGGILYKATSDTTITGTASLYVKVTPSLDGSTASASFVANLTGVSWNHTHGGYYDGGSPDSLYLFDEALAVLSGALASYQTKIAKELISYVGDIAGGKKFSYSQGGPLTTAHTLPSIATNETRIIWFDNPGSTVTTVFTLPSGGTYSASFIGRGLTGTDPNCYGVAGGTALNSVVVSNGTRTCLIYTKVS